MTHRFALRRTATAFALPLTAAALLICGPALAADAAAAQSLARQNNCFKCHDVDTKKVGPAWKEVAVKYKGNKDAEAKLIKHLTGGSPDHPTIKARSPDDTTNLVGWILTLQ